LRTDTIVVPCHVMSLLMGSNWGAAAEISIIEASARDVPKGYSTFNFIDRVCDPHLRKPSQRARRNEYSQTWVFGMLGTWQLRINRGLLFEDVQNFERGLILQAAERAQKGGFEELRVAAYPRCFR
jgi:hypothetical protein